jgi:signal transduction histidine kinase
MSTKESVQTETRIEELAQIIEVYNEVTERLQASHETLTDEVHRLQSQLASANDALQRSKRLAALGEMAAGIAHEIRNPLASIQLYAGMLVDDLTDRPPQQLQATKICSAVRGLDAIVGDVLAYARPLKPRPLNIDLSEAFDRAIHALAPQIDESEIRVVYHIETSTAYVDPDLLHQALLNLIRNATDAMTCDGVLTLAAHRTHGAVRILVRDSGPGIGAEDVDRIFNPFFTTRATGTGLGLAIVHRILDAHGGSILARNGSQGGAVFTLCLPDAHRGLPGDEGDVGDDQNPSRR